MEIKINIKTCKDCCHLSHSGAFTKGGAKPVCDHPDAVKCVNYSRGISEPEGGFDAMNDENHPNYKAMEDYYHWKRRVIRHNFRIPSWCPLKFGKSY